MATFRTTYLLLISLLLSAVAASAQGILFSEKRVILNDRNIYTLQVCNPTETVRSFQLSLVDKTVDIHHKLIDIPDSIAFPSSLKMMVRIFPKRISLLPGECQEVQLQLRNAGTLADGEYRSYLHFLPLMTQVETTPTAEEAQRALNATAPSFDIIIRVGAAIPVFYRKKTTVESLSIDSVRLVRNEKKEPSSLALYIHRKGSQSVYGSLNVYAPINSKDSLVVSYPPSAIYPEVAGRTILIPIGEKTLPMDASGKCPLKIVFTDGEDRLRKDPLCEWTGEVN